MEGVHQNKYEIFRPKALQRNIANISILCFGFQVRISNIFIQDYLASYLVYGAQKTQFKHNRKKEISETSILRVGLVGEIGKAVKDHRSTKGI
jgi:hypothetical protein